MIYKFRAIEGFPGYFVSDKGEVYSMKSKKFLKPVDNGHDYLKVTLCKEGKRYDKRINRLVAQAFLDDYSNALQVDHCDGNRKNNCVSNLRMVTAKENCNNPITYKKNVERWRANGKKHGKTNGMARAKAVIIDGVEYCSQKEASRQLDVPQPTIHRRLNSKNFSNYKYKE